MKSPRLFIAWLLIISLGGCASNVITKEEFAPDMYIEHPTSILVLPPINKTTAADAKEYYATTVAEPLTNSGYYVFPMEVVYDVLQQEGLFDTETMMNVPPQKFREYFGADAVLYVTLLEWNTHYSIVSGDVTVKAACELRSTHTGNVIWFYDEAVEVNTTGDTGGGFLGQLIATAIKTAVQSYIPVARDASAKIFLAMQFGKYHKEFDQDRKSKVEKKKNPIQQEKGK